MQGGPAVCAAWASWSSLELIGGLKAAAIDHGLFLVGTGFDRAGGPAQIEIRPERKDHGRAIDFSLQAHAFRGGRQGEIERAAEDHGIKLAYVGRNMRVVELGLQQEGGGVRPVQCRGGDGAAAVGEPARVYTGKGAWTCDTGGPHVAEIVVGPGIECDGGGRCLPLAVGRAGRLVLTRHISFIHNLKSTDGAAYTCGCA